MASFGFSRTPFGFSSAVLAPSWSTVWIEQASLSLSERPWAVLGISLGPASRLLGRLTDWRTPAERFSRLIGSRRTLVGFLSSCCPLPCAHCIMVPPCPSRSLLAALHAALLSRAPFSRAAGGSARARAGALIGFALRLITVVVTIGCAMDSLPPPSNPCAILGPPAPMPSSTRSGPWGLVWWACPCAPPPSR